MGQDSNNMVTPDPYDGAAGFGVVASGKGTFKPRSITEVGHENGASNHSTPDWNDGYIDQGETLAPRRRHKDDDRYRPVGGPADFSHRLI